MRKIDPAHAVPLSLLLFCGCIAPRAEAEGGSVEELGKMVNEAGVEPVVGTEEQGSTGGIEETIGVDQAAAEAALTDAAAEEEYEEEEYEESPYIRFGERIIVREIEGVTFVTKPYTLPTGRPDKIVQLMRALGPFAYRQRPEPLPAPQPDAEGNVPPTPEIPPLDPDVLEYEILKGFDDEFYTVFPAFDNKPMPPTAVPLSDVFVITATPNLLEEFEDFLDLFAGGGVPQIELEAKIIEIVETDSEDYGVSGGSFGFGTNNFVKSLGINVPNFADGSEALLTLGAVQDQVVFDAILEAVQGWQNVSIESRPRTVVRAGGVARMETTIEIPFLQVTKLDANSNPQFQTSYKRVGTQLWLSPRRVGSNTLALDVHIEGSQRAGSQVVAGGGDEDPIEVPQIAYRTAKTVVHLQPGQTLVIGGLTQEREQEIVNKIPILGDIPILGFFFRSTFKAVEKQHVIFAISPRIIQRGDFESDL